MKSNDAQAQADQLASGRGLSPMAGVMTKPEGTLELGSSAEVPRGFPLTSSVRVRAGSGPQQEKAVGAAETPGPTVEPGSKINLVHANGSFILARVTWVLRSGKVDLQADLGAPAPLAITSSPYDPTGKKPDSWHVPASPASASLAAPAK